MTRLDSRRRRRRFLYLVGLVPSLLLLSVSARIAVLLHHQGQAMDAYAAGDFESAREHFAANGVLNPVERWVAPFGVADARYHLADFEGAVAAFEVALDLVPEENECVVRVNLALAHERSGDQLAGDRHRSEALDAWQTGRQVLRPCKEPERNTDLTDLEERTRATAVRVDERLTEKLGFDGPVSTRPPGEAPPEEVGDREKQRRLQERNRQAHKDNVENKDEFEDSPEPPLSPSAEPTPTPQW